MILVKTPFRIPLGGGSTDLPAYYEKYGGFIFSAAINLYMYISITRPPADDLIRLKYRASEEVERVSELKHNLARAALMRLGIDRKIEIASIADVSDGTGMGSSGSYLVGLLNGLHALKGEDLSPQELAEEAFNIAVKDLNLPDGKHDFYLAAFGGFCVLDIGLDGLVRVIRPKINDVAKKRFEQQTLLFYTGLRRSSVDILKEQQNDIKKNKIDALKLKHRTKQIGQQILHSFEDGDLDRFGELLDEHWEVKKRMSQKMSNANLDAIYNEAKRCGAFGGKIMGAGGGGFFLVFCRDGFQDAVRGCFAKHGLPEVKFKIAPLGSRIVINQAR